VKSFGYRSISRWCRRIRGFAEKTSILRSQHPELGTVRVRGAARTRTARHARSGLPDLRDGRRQRPAISLRYAGHTSVGSSALRQTRQPRRGVRPSRHVRPRCADGPRRDQCCHPVPWRAHVEHITLLWPAERGPADFVRRVRGFIARRPYRSLFDCAWPLADASGGSRSNTNPAGRAPRRQTR
jgi:hypothetical protein